MVHIVVVCCPYVVLQYQKHGNKNIGVIVYKPKKLSQSRPRYARAWLRSPYQAVVAIGDQVLVNTPPRRYYLVVASHTPMETINPYTTQVYGLQKPTAILIT